MAQAILCLTCTVSTPPPPTPLRLVVFIVWTVAHIDLLFSFSPSPPWFIIPCSSLTSYLLSKWCRRWPRRLSRRSPPRWSSSSPSNFPNPLWQVRGLLIIPHTLHVQAKDNIWNDQRKHILASFRNRIFQILPGSVLPLIMTNEKMFVAKYKQFRDKMKMYQSQFSDEISKRILSTLDYG